MVSQDHQDAVRVNYFVKLVYQNRITCQARREQDTIHIALFGIVEVLIALRFVTSDFANLSTNAQHCGIGMNSHFIRNVWECIHFRLDKPHSWTIYAQ